MSGRRSPSGARAADGSRTTTCCGEVGRTRQNVFAAACCSRSRLRSSPRPGWLRSLGPAPDSPTTRARSTGTNTEKAGPAARAGALASIVAPAGVSAGAALGSIVANRGATSAAAAFAPTEASGSAARLVPFAARASAITSSTRPISFHWSFWSFSSGFDGFAALDEEARRDRPRDDASGCASSTRSRPRSHDAWYRRSRSPASLASKPIVDGRLRSLEVLGQQGLQPLLLLGDHLQQRRLAALRVRRPHPRHQPALTRSAKIFFCSRNISSARSLNSSGAFGFMAPLAK